MENKNPIYEVYTPTEAAIKWGLNESTIRKAIQTNRFTENIDYRKAGRVTIISRIAIERLYGKPKEEI